MTGEPFTFAAWGAGEPGTDPKETAITFAVNDVSKKAGWHDIAADGQGNKDRRGGYIVEWDAAGAATAREAADNYVLDPSAIPGRNEPASVELPRFLVPSDPMTIEMQITPRSRTPEAVSRGLWSLAGVLELKQYGDRLVWQRNNDQAAPKIEQVAATMPDYGRRLHVAAVSTGTELRLFIDGKLAEKKTLVNPLPSNQDLPINLFGFEGSNGGYQPFDGTVDKIRISKTARYDADFTPPDRYETDSDTLAMYDCNEAGDQLVDVSGNNNHGKINGVPRVPVAAATAQAAPQTIDLIGLLDLTKDRVAAPNYTAANNWSIAGGKLTYTTDGQAGKLVAPVDVRNARDYEIVCDVRGHSADGPFTIDFAPAADKWSGIDVFIGDRQEIKLENGKRTRFGVWPEEVKDGGKVALRVRHGVDNAPGSVAVSVNDVEVARWEGNVAAIGGAIETHPDFPGTQNIGLFCFRDTFDFTSWQLRVYDGSAAILRPAMGSMSPGSSPTPAGPGKQ